jgi:hypothetical protein
MALSVNVGCPTRIDVNKKSVSVERVRCIIGISICLFSFIYQNYCGNIERCTGTIVPFRCVFSFISSASNEIYWSYVEKIVGNIVKAEISTNNVKSNYAIILLQAYHQ